MTPVHVLHIVDSLAVGGLERGVVNVVERLDPRRFRHSICAVRNLGALAGQLKDRADVNCLFRRPGRFSVVAGQLARHIRQIRPHVVHARNWGAVEGVWAGRWARAAGVVFSEHGVETNAEDPALKRWLRRIAYESAHQVFSVSFALRQFHADRTGFPAGRIAVIRNGVDTARYSPAANLRVEMRRELGAAEGEICIGVIGRLEPVKDQATLLRAAARLERSRPWRIVVAGEGREAAALRRQAAETPALAGRVQFLGETDRTAALLNALDIYVLPSLSEGISNSLLEAMATGLPAVATRTGGNPEVVQAMSGRLFAVGEDGELAGVLRDLIADPALRTSLGHCARQRVLDHFSIEAMTAQYAELYGRWAANGRGAA